ncbi:Rqc2 family fibronectin-binding protein [Tepidibacter hydrothermalis]|uniref:Rqc2 homolog RqcH n=1 Tax=Tepidibacter hydrothermalis TaxID=3036126 RepID=A0ABY8E888_9FIRM|nr:NFACT RNA binding domain-containing protein [Tepidibacter hydrothermalis]WFD09110.1 NFACT RNA binding domain-containing protein [Tepidibacter hydrothermalis]
MALDGLVINSLVKELSSQLVDGKIDKIYQPEDDELLFNIRSNNTNYKLLISANSSNPRVYTTNSHNKKNPIKAPLFCMLLRKHIQNGRIIKIEQPGFERIIKITIESLDELKIRKSKDLIIEIMGRHSNIILVDNEENKVLDSIKRVPLSVSRYRQVLPGQKYINPPSQNKLNPVNTIDEKTFIDTLLNSSKPELYKSIYSSFEGISPVVAKEICIRAKLDMDININHMNKNDFASLYEIFNRLFNQIKNNIFFPCIAIDKRLNKIIDFSCIKLTMFNHYSFIENDSINVILETYYLEKDVKERIHQKSQSLRKSISNKLDRLYKKSKKQNEELLESKNADKYKINGELITAYIYMIQKGMDEVEVANFYNPNSENVTIRLDKRLTPSENAQKYFKKYNKLKHALIEITEQLKITQEEINYLENIMLSITNCESIDELDEIKEELIKVGYVKGKVKDKGKKNKEKNILKTAPYEFLSSDGFKVFVGKNNKQNDYLTLKMATNNDMWLHTKDIPGSHVIIRSEGGEIPESTIFEAAMLAAYYSKGKMSSKVPVDYTLKKNVKKPSGAKPGMVIYETNSTMYVTPLEEEIVKIQNHVEIASEDN